jgi:hypothetical protein
MFEQLRESLRAALGRASTPEEGREVLAMMRDAIVQAKMAVHDLKAGVEATRKKLERERTELETVRRRGKLASEINDAETVRVAGDYERKHTGRVEVLERKLAAQEAELALAQEELGEMTRQLKLAGAAGGRIPMPGQAPAGVDEPDPDAELRRDIDRATRASQAEQQLAELKRRMGK